MVRIQTLISVGDRERRWRSKTLWPGRKIIIMECRKGTDCENVKKKKPEALEEVWDGDKRQ